MPPISKLKQNKISEHILFLLFENFPKPLFTSKIAEEMARDEEFTKKLLHSLKIQELVVPITKNNYGVKYSRRIRWRLSNKAHEVYSNKTTKAK